MNGNIFAYMGEFTFEIHARTRAVRQPLFTNTKNTVQVSDPIESVL